MYFKWILCACLGTNKWMRRSQGTRPSGVGREDGTTPGIGRPTAIGRPTSKASDTSKTESLHIARRKFDGLWTSETHRTSDDPTQKTSKLRRKSDGLRTPDTSDVRCRSDIRHLSAHNELGSAHVPLPSPLDYKYLFPTSFLGLAKNIPRFERA